MNTRQIESFINTCNTNSILKCDHIDHSEFRVPYYNMQSGVQAESNNHSGTVQIELDMVLHFLKNRIPNFERYTNFEMISLDWSNLSNWHQVGKVKFLNKEYNLFEKAKNCYEFFKEDRQVRDVNDIDGTESYRMNQLMGMKSHIPCESLGCDRSVTRLPIYRQELLKINFCSECSKEKTHLRQNEEKKEDEEEEVESKCAKME